MILKVAILLNAPSLSIEIKEKHIICADGGFKLLQNRIPDAIVGDFDSLDYIPKGIPIIKHPSEKNYTDGELALRYAVESGYNNIVLYGGIGGRLDHVLGNIALLKLADTLGATAVIREKDLTLHYSSKDFTLKTKKGETVSILPYGGKAIVEYSEGLYYPLIDLTLLPDDTRGISNIALGDTARIRLKSGEVIIFHYEK